MSTIFNWDISIDEHVQITESDEIRPSLIKYLPKKGKILEGGAGIGRWCIYSQKLSFGSIVGTASKAGEVKLNIFGKLVNKILMQLSKNTNNHMFLYIVRKVESKRIQH